MRVLTQNLWGVRGAWELRRKVIQQGLAELKPDVVSLQEAIKTTDVDSAAATADGTAASGWGGWFAQSMAAPGPR